MKRVVWSYGVLATIALLLFPARPALAQGVSSAAVAGRITDESGAPVYSSQRSRSRFQGRSTPRG